MARTRRAPWDYAKRTWSTPEEVRQFAEIMSRDHCPACMKTHTVTGGVCLWCKKQYSEDESKYLHLRRDIIECELMIALYGKADRQYERTLLNEWTNKLADLRWEAAFVEPPKVETDEIPF